MTGRERGVATTDFARTIWILWWQGFDEAPELVQRCLGSWRTLNPGWTVVELDSRNVSQYVSLDQVLGEGRTDVSMQARSDIVRINILAAYGGVWVDATCLCRASLDSWLDRYMTSGFFAFRKPGRDRLLSTWFLAAVKGNYLVAGYRDRVNSYWRSNRFVNGCLDCGRRRLILRPLIALGHRGTRFTRLWFWPIVTKRLKGYPYYWFHYLMEELIRTDPKSRKAWDSVPEFRARPIVAFARPTKLVQHLTPTTKDFIDGADAPLYKLSWKYDSDEAKSGTVIHYLLETAAR